MSPQLIIPNVGFYNLFKNFNPWTWANNHNTHREGDPKSKHI